MKEETKTLLKMYFLFVVACVLSFCLFKLIMLSEKIEVIKKVQLTPDMYHACKFIVQDYDRQQKKYGYIKFNLEPIQTKDCDWACREFKFATQETQWLVVDQ